MKIYNPSTLFCLHIDVFEYSRKSSSIIGRIFILLTGRSVFLLPNFASIVFKRYIQTKPKRCIWCISLIMNYTRPLRLYSPLSNEYVNKYMNIYISIFLICCTKNNTLLRRNHKSYNGSLNWIKWSIWLIYYHHWTSHSSLTALAILCHCDLHVMKVSQKIIK